VDVVLPYAGYRDVGVAYPDVDVSSLPRNTGFELVTIAPGYIDQSEIYGVATTRAGLLHRNDAENPVLVLVSKVVLNRFENVDRRVFVGFDRDVEIVNHLCKRIASA